MNSIVSGTTIEPIMQRMSSVEDDHASVVSNDDEESSRDRHVDEDEDDVPRQDPSEKPDDVLLVQGDDIGVVASEHSSNNNNNSHGVVQSPVEEASVGGSEGGVLVSSSVADVDSPMVVVDGDDDDDEEDDDEQEEDVDDDVDASERVQVTATRVLGGGVNSQNSDNPVASEVAIVSGSIASADQNQSVGDEGGGDDDDVSAIADTDRIYEQARVEIALLSAAVDVLSRQRSENAPSAVGGGGGAIRTRHHTTQPLAGLATTTATTASSSSPFAPRYWPYHVPTAASRASSSNSNSREGPPQPMQPGPRRRTLQATVPSPSSSTTTTSTAAANQSNVQGSNATAAAPQQVIRSAIVGNRTIITTKTPSKFPFSAELKQAGAAILGDRYILLDLCDGTSLYKCIDVKTKEEFVCKIANNPCTSLLEAHFRLESHPHINPFRKVIHGAQHTYLLFEPSQGDLHSYVRIRKRLREAEAKRLFRQMCETVKACHDQGIVLRDLKLRKFIFADEEKTQLRLESLEDAVVLEDPRDDLLQDKRGCPAYVSPEILKANTTYSGKAADMWSLGVILYTMLVGRYPFNDSEHASLFAKISRGHFHVPECLSSKARCVIRALLRKHPEERITSEDLLDHPWLTKENFRESVRSCHDQMVPLYAPKRARREAGDEMDTTTTPQEELYEVGEEEEEGEREREVMGGRHQDGVPVLGASLLSARFGALGSDSLMATGGGGGDGAAGADAPSADSFMNWLRRA